MCIVRNGLISATTGIIENVVWLPGATRSELPLAVLVSCTTCNGLTLWHTEPHPDFPNGVPIVPITPLKTTFEIMLGHSYLSDWLGQSLSINLINKV